MEVTVAGIRREYATPRALWAQTLLLGLGFLAVLETARQVLSHGGAAQVAVGAGLFVGALMGLLAYGVGRIVRQASLSPELWRKFGLAEPLLLACRDLGPLNAELEQEVDLALRDLRSLAAVANHQLWDDAGLGDPMALTERAEVRLTERLRDGLTVESLRPLRIALGDLALSQTSLLAALVRDDPDEVAVAAAGWREATTRFEAS